MIPFDFEYYQPASIAEAVQLYNDLQQNGKAPMYYGGGTEIITMARNSSIKTQAVIDIKQIPECQQLETKGQSLIIGAAVTLTAIAEANPFPLLTQAGSRVADHSVQNKITLGGNVCGTIIYREAVLPLLLADSEVCISGINESRTESIHTVFDQQMRLNNGELVVQFKIPLEYTSLPHWHVKKTKLEKIDYPLITLCALKKDGDIRIALSGACSFPFRGRAMEKALNQPGEDLSKRVDQALQQLPGPLQDTVAGSSDYRRFVLGNLLEDAMHCLEG